MMTSPLFRGEVGVIDDSIIDDLISRLMDGNSIEDFKFTRRQVSFSFNLLLIHLQLGTISKILHFSYSNIVYRYWT